MKLSPQKKYLLGLLEIGGWVCSNSIDSKIVRDYRKRISEMNREGFKIRSEVCKDTSHGHKASVHMYLLVDAPKPPPKQVFYVKHPLTGERITSEELRKL